MKNRLKEDRNTENNYSNKLKQPNSNKSNNQQKNILKQSASNNSKKRSNEDNNIQNEDNSDTGSFMGDLEEVRMEGSIQNSLMIKICDGVYIGGDKSIWDIEAMSANYITHLIRIQQIKQKANEDNNNKDSKQERYVPQIITHLHIIEYKFNVSSKCSTNLVRVFCKISQFIDHAHEGGQSCIIINDDIYSAVNEFNVFDCVYRPAVIAVGYLMYKYNWALLKSLQFISSRLTASQKTWQTLQLANSTLSHAYKMPTSHKNDLSNLNKDKNLTGMYSQLLAHMVPELPHQNTSSTIQIWPDVSKLPIQSLKIFENELISTINKEMSYGWNKNEIKQISEQELVLANTYLNSMMVSTYQTMLNNESRNKLMKSNSKEKSKNAYDLNRRSLKIINKNNQSYRESKTKASIKGDKANKQNGILKTDRSKQLKSRHSLSSGNIGLKLNIQTTPNYQNSIPFRQISTQKKQPSKQLQNLIKETHRISNKLTQVKEKRRVEWQSNIVQQAYEQEQKQNQQNAAVRKERRRVSADEKIEKTQIQDYRKLIENKLNSEVRSIQNKENKESTGSRIIEKDEKNLNKNLPTAMKNKIIVNVIDIIQSKNSSIGSEKSSTQRTLISKKSSINQSKAKLPTIHDILKESNLHNTSNQAGQDNQNLKNSQIFRCKTVSNLQDAANKENHLHFDENLTKRDSLKNYVDVEIGMVMSQGNQYYTNKLHKASKTLPINQTTQITQLSHEEERNILGLETWPIFIQKQNSSNQKNVLRDQYIQTQRGQSLPSQLGLQSQIKSIGSSKVVDTKSRIVEATMNKLKQYKNSSSLKSSKVFSQVIMQNGSTLFSKDN